MDHAIPRRRTHRRRRFDGLKLAVFLLCLLPLGHLLWRGVAGGLGVNPIETITRDLGDWALRLLWLTLLVTPLRQASEWQRIARLRRMLGLFAFFYVCLHLASYVVLDQFFDWMAIWRDIIKRNYITVGMAAFVLLVPLAVTSTSGMIRRLGGQRWRTLHRAVYPAAAFAALHYFWMVKRDVSQPLMYAGVLGILLGIRLFPLMRARVAAMHKEKCGSAQIPSE